MPESSNISKLSQDRYNAVRQIVDSLAWLKGPTNLAYGRNLEDQAKLDNLILSTVAATNPSVPDITADKLLTTMQEFQARLRQDMIEGLGVPESVLVDSVAPQFMPGRVGYAVRNDWGGSWAHELSVPSVGPSDYGLTQELDEDPYFDAYADEEWRRERARIEQERVEAMPGRRSLTATRDIPEEEEILEAYPWFQQVAVDRETTVMEQAGSNSRLVFEIILLQLRISGVSNGTEVRQVIRDFNNSILSACVYQKMIVERLEDGWTIVRGGSVSARLLELRDEYRRSLPLVRGQAGRPASETQIVNVVQGLQHPVNATQPQIAGLPVWLAGSSPVEASRLMEAPVRQTMIVDQEMSADYYTRIRSSPIAVSGMVTVSSDYSPYARPVPPPIPAKPTGPSQLEKLTKGKRKLYRG